MTSGQIASALGMNDAAVPAISASQVKKNVR